LDAGSLLQRSAACLALVFVDAMNGYFTEDNPAKRAIAVYQPWPTAPQIKGLR
jgi:hypothetical protein